MDTQTVTPANGENTPRNNFSKYFNQTKESARRNKEPLVEKALKRQLQSAFDDAERKIDTLQNQVEASRANVENYQINSVLSASSDIASLRTIQANIKAEYYFMFGEEMPTR